MSTKVLPPAGAIKTLTYACFLYFVPLILIDPMFIMSNAHDNYINLIKTGLPLTMLVGAVLVAYSGISSIGKKSEASASLYLITFAGLCLMVYPIMAFSVTSDKIQESWIMFLRYTENPDIAAPTILAGIFVLFLAFNRISDGTANAISKSLIFTAIALGLFWFCSNSLDALSKKEIDYWDDNAVKAYHNDINLYRAGIELAVFLIFGGMISTIISLGAMAKVADDREFEDTTPAAPAPQAPQSPYQQYVQQSQEPAYSNYQPAKPTYTPPTPPAKVPTPPAPPTRPAQPEDDGGISL